MKLFPEKLAKKLPEAYAETVQAMDAEEIKKRMFECEGNVYVIEDDLATNEKIIAAKDELKEMTSPYRESKAAENAKIKFCLWVLEERGIEIGVGEKK